MLRVRKNEIECGARGGGGMNWHGLEFLLHGE